MSGSEGTEVKVRLMQRPADRSYYLEIRVRSVARPRVIRIGVVDYRSEHLERRIGLVAGAIAEELNEAYNDRIEPSAAAQAAVELFRELMRVPVVEEGDEPPGSESRLARN